MKTRTQRWLQWTGRMLSGMSGRWWLIICLSAPAAYGANNWYTGRTVNNQTRPIAAGITASAAEGKAAIVNSTATVTNGLVDLVISLYCNPQGDDDGNTQGNPGSEEQDNYEHIVQYFADAVYEATEGVHSIRNVRIYRGGQRQDADVIWEKTGWPTAWGHLNTSGKATHISYSDVYDTENLTNSTGHEVGGYGLAHEWGHYFYGLYDEYCRWNGAAWQNLNWVDKEQPAIMNWQWGARNRVYSWVNFSIAWQGHTNNYAPYENRRKTAQHQLLGCSCWESLAKNPTNDPLTTAYQQSFRNGSGKRMYYPELATVAPVGTNPPRIDLSSTASVTTLPSRNSLNIIWMGSNMVVELIIDYSPSMDDESKLDNAKTAAKLLVDQIPDHSAVGLVGFDAWPSEYYAITIITNSAGRTAVKSAIDSLSGWSGTAIGDAAVYALERIQAFGHTNMTRVAFLLTDGESNTGSDPLDAIPSYQNAQVPIMGLGFGSSVDARLSTMATSTGGRYYYSPVSLGAIAAAFRDAYTMAAARQKLANGTASPGGTSFKADGAINIGFTVDSTISDLSVTLSHAVSYTVTVTLNAPDGTAYPASSTNQSSTERLLYYNVSAPQIGHWSIAGTASAGAQLQYQVEAGVNEFTYNLDASAAGQSVVSFPNPIEIAASLDRVHSVDRASVTAFITATNSTTTTTLPLTNNAHGQYSGFFLASNNVYNVIVRADNSNGTAYITYAGVLPSALPDGNLPPMPADEPITENFSRAVTTFQVTMSNVPPTLTAPGASASLAASDGTYGNEVAVFWSTVTNAQIYEIWRSTSDQVNSAAKLTEVASSATNYYDDSAAVNVVYYYWVRAKNLIGTGGFSPSDAGWLMSPPTGLTASEGAYGCEIQVNWTASEGADSYTLYRSALNDTQSAVPIVADTTATSYVDTDATRGTNYYYYVTLTRNGNSSRYSDPDIGWRVYLVSPVADYDGDRKAEPTIYNERSSSWSIKLSRSGYLLLTTTLNSLGGLGYSSLAADFDGDGLSDPAVYENSTGTWKVLLSRSGYVMVNLPAFMGGTGYMPLAADFDGDGFGDLAVYQEATGNWQVKLSCTGYATLNLNGLLGGPGYEAFAADFDGDGKADPAVYKLGTGDWIVLLSSANYTRIPLANFMGGSGWYPVADDYDGDGKADPAVYNETTGAWHIKLSGSSYYDITLFLF